MTGEIFAVLRQHSILGRLMATDAMPDLNAAAFEAGAEVGLNHADDLLHRLFQVRTLGCSNDSRRPRRRVISPAC